MLVTAAMTLVGLIFLALQRYIKKRLFKIALYIWGFGLVIIASMRLDFYTLSILWVILYLLAMVILATLIHFIIYKQMLTWSKKYPDWIGMPK